MARPVLFEKPQLNSDSGRNLMPKEGLPTKVTESVQRDLLHDASHNGHASDASTLADQNQIRELTQTAEATPAVLQPPVIQPQPLPEKVVGNGHANGDPRRTLHLSLGGTPHPNGAGNGRSHPPESHDARIEQPEKQAAPVIPEPYYRPGPVQRPYDRAPGGFADGHAPYADTRDNGPKQANGSSFIDQELRARVDGDIAAFLAAFDAALLQDSPESRTGLREATDRLLRAGARTRIELERLEARIPLPPRDRLHSEPAWRAR